MIRRAGGQQIKPLRSSSSDGSSSKSRSSSCNRRSRSTKITNTLTVGLLVAVVKVVVPAHAVAPHKIIL